MNTAALRKDMLPFILFGMNPFAGLVKEVYRKCSTLASFPLKFKEKVSNVIFRSRKKQIGSAERTTDASESFEFNIHGTWIAFCM